METTLTKWNHQLVRNTFIQYFEKHQHHHLPSSSVIPPEEDTSLFFTNAGMNQFKNIFLGKEEAPYSRVVNSQRCVRAGGKHNDLADVGKDTYHHTFFEMLGNWSLADKSKGGFFKEEAIAYAWDLLINVYQLDKKRIYVTYFGGDSKLSLDADLETASIWEKYLDKDRILSYGMEDNFWEMAETGPCGPCTEIHYDMTDDLSGKSLVNQGDEEVIEIWNLVFTSFLRKSATEFEPLQNKFVDTGAGLERLVMVLNHKKSNYQTDVFKYLMDVLQEKNLGKAEIYHHRKIADHIRCLVVVLRDGGNFGNHGRNYVIRKIFREMYRILLDYYVDYNRVLQYLLTLSSNVLDKYFSFKYTLKDVYVLILDEINVYNRTIKNGTRKLKKMIKKEIITGETAGFLMETYGLPFEITYQICLELKGTEYVSQIKYDEYEKHMIIHKKKSSNKSLEG